MVHFICPFYRVDVSAPCPRAESWSNLWMSQPMPDNWISRSVNIARIYSLYCFDWSHIGSRHSKACSVHVEFSWIPNSIHTSNHLHLIALQSGLWSEEREKYWKLLEKLFNNLFLMRWIDAVLGKMRSSQKELNIFYVTLFEFEHFVFVLSANKIYLLMQAQKN